MSDVYSQIVFNRTADEVTTFEEQRSKPAFTPAWILKITWDHVMPVSYQKINFSEVKGVFESCLGFIFWKWLVFFLHYQLLETTKHFLNEILFVFFSTMSCKSFTYLYSLGTEYRR